MEAEVIRSRRKTLSIQIKEGRVIVRAPLRAANAEISRFLQAHRNWIQVHLAKSLAAEQAKQQVPKLTKDTVLPSSLTS